MYWIQSTGLDRVVSAVTKEDLVGAIKGVRVEDNLPVGFKNVATAKRVKHFLNHVDMSGAVYDIVEVSSNEN